MQSTGITTTFNYYPTTTITIIIAAATATATLCVYHLIFSLTHVYICLLFQSVIKKKYGQDATNVGDEGGFAPNIQVCNFAHAL